MAGLQIQIRSPQGEQHIFSLDRPTEIGRQSSEDEALFSFSVLNPDEALRSRLAECGLQPIGMLRLVVQRIKVEFISRHQLVIEPRPITAGDERFRVTNISTVQDVIIRGEKDLRLGESRNLQTDDVLVTGGVEIRLKDTDKEDPYSLVQPVAAPGNVTIVLPQQFPMLSDDDASAVGELLRTVSLVMQSAASSTDFYDKAAEGLVELVELDSGRVLLWEADEWKAAARRTKSGISIGLPPSKRILKRVREERKTFWDHPKSMSGDEESSLHGVEIVVAAPILDEGNNVIGAVYGEKLRTTAPAGRRISKLDALIVETLGCCVAAGLARLERERQAVAAKIQFQQFFSTELAEQLTTNPGLLDGRDAEVTLLFCDIRSFSRFAGSMEPAETMALIKDVLGMLSDCVHKYHGVLVDYVGDELFAMWGAPKEQPDHAQLACSAALDMLRGLPELNKPDPKKTWQAKLGEPVYVGIGINTGVARIGNTGSHLKFKYGPLGDPVNIASRIQGATKHLKCTALISKVTQSQLGAGFSTRRICSVRMVNIDKPIELFELSLASDKGWQGLKKRYEEALKCFEDGSFSDSCGILGQLLPIFPEDGPLLVLMSRAAAALVEKPVQFDPAWSIPK